MSLRKKKNSTSSLTWCQTFAYYKVCCLQRWVRFISVWQAAITPQHNDNFHFDFHLNLICRLNDLCHQHKRKKKKHRKVYNHATIKAGQIPSPEQPVFISLPGQTFDPQPSNFTLPVLYSIGGLYSMILKLCPGNFPDQQKLATTYITMLHGTVEHGEWLITNKLPNT